MRTWIQRVFLVYFFLFFAFCLLAGDKAKFITSENNVRASPDLKAPIIAKPARDSFCEVIQKKDKWFEIILPTGQKGWTNQINIAMVTGDIENSVPERGEHSKAPSGQEISNGEWVCNGDDVNVRSGYGDNYKSFKVLYQLGKGDKVKILDKKGDWLRISSTKAPNGTTEGQWVLGKYISTVKKSGEVSNPSHEEAKALGNQEKISGETNVPQGNNPSSTFKSTDDGDKEYQDPSEDEIKSELLKHRVTHWDQCSVYCFEVFADKGTIASRYGVPATWGREFSVLSINGHWFSSTDQDEARATVEKALKVKGPTKVIAVFQNSSSTNPITKIFSMVFPLGKIGMNFPVGYAQGYRRFPLDFNGVEIIRISPFGAFERIKKNIGGRDEETLRQDFSFLQEYFPDLGVTQKAQNLINQRKKDLLLAEAEKNRLKEQNEKAQKEEELKQEQEKIRLEKEAKEREIAKNLEDDKRKIQLEKERILKDKDLKEKEESAKIAKAEEFLNAAKDLIKSGKLDEADKNIKDAIALDFRGNLLEEVSQEYASERTKKDAELKRIQDEQVKTQKEKELKQEQEKIRLEKESKERDIATKLDEEKKRIQLEKEKALHAKDLSEKEEKAREAKAEEYLNAARDLLKGGKLDEAEKNIQEAESLNNKDPLLEAIKQDLSFQKAKKESEQKKKLASRAVLAGDYLVEKSLYKEAEKKYREALSLDESLRSIVETKLKLVQEASPEQKTEGSTKKSPIANEKPEIKEPKQVGSTDLTLDSTFSQGKPFSLQRKIEIVNVLGMKKLIEYDLEVTVEYFEILESIKSNSKIIKPETGMKFFVVKQQYKNKLVTPFSINDTRNLIEIGDGQTFKPVPTTLPDILEVRNIDGYTTGFDVLNCDVLPGKDKKFAAIFQIPDEFLKQSKIFSYNEWCRERGLIPVFKVRLN